MTKRPNDDFTIVFEQIEDEPNEQDPIISIEQSEADFAEIDEIDELRRIVLDLAEPEPSSYTTT